MKIKIFLVVFTFGFSTLLGGISYAASNSDFSQTINAGTLATDIKDDSRNSVASPAVTMGAVSFSFDCLAGGSASSGTFGTNSERVYVTNGDAADSGWNLTVAATGGATDAWANGTPTDTIDFNDATGSTAGCGDGADGDSLAGQMTIDPSVSTVNTDCNSCDNSTGISKGSSSAYVEGTTDSINLLASDGSQDVWRGYLTGVDVSQTIPAETVADTYTINLTLTATAT